MTRQIIRRALAAALLVGAILPSTSDAQSRSSGSSSGSSQKSIAPLTGTLPPSSVSPAIARFMTKHPETDDLPAPSARMAVPPLISQSHNQIADSIEDLVVNTNQEESAVPVPLAPRKIGTFVEDDNPLATGLDIKAAPLAATDIRLPINLATALRLADARPLVVAAAQASVWVAEANLNRAKVLWIPMLCLGFDYQRHIGGGPDFNGGNLSSSNVNFFYGGGGICGVITTSDAFFQPLITRQILNAKHCDIQTSKNDVLYKTADAYFRVHQARGIYAGALYTVERGRELVERIEALSHDLVPKVEVDRARNLLADLEQRAALARQEWRVQSANLTQVLRLDPRAIVEPLEHDHAQITLIDPTRSLDELMPIAVLNRPELGSLRATVQAAELSVRNEKARFYMPQILLNGFQTPSATTETDASHALPILGVPGESRLVEGGPNPTATAGLIQYGAFGLGKQGNLNQWVARDDFSVQFIWQLEDLGLGTLARIKVQRGNQSKAIIQLRKMQDTIVGDIHRALAHVQMSAVRVYQADIALRTGIITYNGNLEGLNQTKRFENVLILVNRPEEVVYSLDLLYTAFVEYISTVADYNCAQFELFRALGCPARELTELCLPGETLPVDLSRPGTLPYVQNGPPPASR